MAEQQRELEFDADRGRWVEAILSRVDRQQLVEALVELYLSVWPGKLQPEDKHANHAPRKD